MNDLSAIAARRGWVGARSRVYIYIPVTTP
jgi:hypothetical protein